MNAFDHAAVLGQGFSVAATDVCDPDPDSYENLNAVTRQMLAEMAKNPASSRLMQTCA